MKTEHDLDLKLKNAWLKAELAQKKRELEIESALERVRAVAMGMRSPDDLIDICKVLFDELTALGFTELRNAMLNIVNDERGSFLNYDFNCGNSSVTQFSHNSHPLIQRQIEITRSAGDAFIEHILTGDELEDFKAFRVKNGEVPDPKLQNIDALHYYFYSIGEGSVGISTFNSLKEENLKVLKRFRNVFDLAYRRYLDIKQAEEQAREAQIQLALERVRARTMAMQHSDELAETVFILFRQFKELGENPDQATIGIVNENERVIEYWVTMYGNQENKVYKFSIDEPHVTRKIYDGWKKHKKSLVIDLSGKELHDFATYRESMGGAKLNRDEKRRIINVAFFSKGLINVQSTEERSEESIRLLERFAAVFDGTYTRFLDLQKAEAAAREAQTEASLERVRSKAMAMRNSGDLSAAASTVFVELRNLGINPIRSGVGLLSKNVHTARIYSDTSLQKGTDLSLIGEVDLSLHPVFEQQYQSWLKRENYFVALGGKELASYYKILSAGLNANLGITVKNEQKEYGHWFMFSEGFLYAWSDKEYTDAEMKILERFKNIIELTFRRYVELQQSEASAKEAIKQASLDRVRAEIASMRTRQDLERITPLIWNELTILGIPFIRCGVFIMDEEQKLIHTFLSTPDGRAIGAFNVPVDTSGNFEKMVDSWRHNVPYIDHWKEEAFSQFADTLLKQGAISSKAQYMRTLPHEGMYLNFLPFLQGMLYVGNTKPLSNEHINLIQSVAEAFSTAYARYEDFNKLEAAKQQVDNALTQLKATQRQLIQSEKMASLGELIAGIAHEIQNPLNFVNNFSEVSAELIEEMSEEMEKGDIEEAKAIASDIKNNLEKIRHHGKRADGIVKSMLQHSRASSNVKEPTDINKLADEYLHLAYHGMRAKDKSFNAELITHFDEKLPKANVVPQDIGRVILNMINNGFYAMQQKAKANVTAYKPSIDLTTAINNGLIEIRVKDNGSGVPENIKDKIMQPFFTTKPTGEGTGLGLSLSYDIVVKGHGGKINIESKEGEGSEFIIDLPI